MIRMALLRRLFRTSEYALIQRELEQVEDVKNRVGRGTA